MGIVEHHFLQAGCQLSFLSSNQ